MKSGWVTKKLGEVCEDSIRRLKDIDDTNFLYVDIAAIDRERKIIVGATEHDRQTAPGRAQQVVEVGDVLVSTVRPNLNAVAIVEQQPCVRRIASTGFCVLRARECVLPRYIYYFTQVDKFIAKLVAVSEKAAYPSVTDKIVKDVSIPIPPLAEQKRIVAKIDAAFEKIDRLKANAEKNLANAKELFQSALDEAMRPKKGWVEKRLGEVGSCKNGLNFKRAAEGEKIDIVGVGDFKKGLVVDDATELERLTLQELPEHEWYLQPNDIVFVRSNGSKALVGRAVIIKAKRPLTFSGFCIRYRIEDKCIDPDYLARIVSVESFRKAMLSGRNATTINNVTQPILLSQVISIPSLAEQKQIAKRLDLLSQKIEALQQNYARQIADCAEMRQAILREAFEGRL